MLLLSSQCRFPVHGESRYMMFKPNYARSRSMLIAKRFIGCVEKRTEKRPQSRVVIEEKGVGGFLSFAEERRPACSGSPVLRWTP